MGTTLFDELKPNRNLGYLTFLTSMGIFMDGFSLSIFSVALLYLEYSFLKTPFEISLGASAIYFGMLIGSLIFGYLSDLLGRRIMYILDLTITSAFLFLTAFSTNLLEFFIFQFFAGIGIGADYPIAASIQAEFSPRFVRGKYLVINMLSWTFGALVLYTLSIPIVLWGGNYAWRLMYIVGAVIPMIVVIFRSKIPESPYWLLKEGRDSEASKISKKFANTNSNIDFPPIEKGSSNIKDLRKYMPLVIFTSVAWFSYDVSSYGVWNYTPSLFSNYNSYTMSVISTIIETVPVILGTIFCLTYVDKIGRRNLQSFGFLFAGLALLLFAIIFMHSTMPFLMIFTAFALMHFFHNIGPTNLTYLYPPEVYPTKIRGIGMGIATASSRVGAILGVFVFPLIISKLNVSFGLMFFALFEFLGFTVTILLAPETKLKHLS